MAGKVSTTIDIQPIQEPVTNGSSSRRSIGQPTEHFEVDDNEVNRAANDNVNDTNDAISSQDEIVYPTGVAFWMTLASLALMVLFIGLDMTIVAVTIPSLTDQFKTVNDIGWYSSVFMLICSSFTFLFSKAYTVFDVKRVFLMAVILFQIGSLLCTVAPVSSVFILGRAVTGLGGAGLNMGGTTILTYTFPPQKRPMWYGIFAAIQTIAMVAAPLIGGALVDAFSWRACFGINLPVGALAFIVIAFYFKNPVANPDTKLPFKTKLQRMDLLGSAVFVPAIVCLLIALQWGGTRYGWTNARVISLMVLFGVLTGIFGYIQYHERDGATLPPRILKRRSVIAGAFFSAFCSGILSITEYYIAIYFQSVRGYSASKSGALGLPMIIGLSIGALSAGVLTTMLGYYHPFMLLTSVIAPITTGLLTTTTPDESLVRTLILLGVLGTGVGLGLQGPASAIQAILPTKDIPIGIAINSFAGGLGTAIFLSSAAALFQNRLVDELSHLTTKLDTQNNNTTIWLGGAGNNTTNINTNTNSTGIGADIGTLLDSSGLADIRKYIGGDRLREVLLGYDKAVMQTFYIPVGCGILCLIASLTIEWKSVKVKKA